VKPAKPFWSLVQEDADSGCWIWKGTVSRYGYGLHYQDRKTFRAHRFAYEQMVAPVPEGLVLDHLCKTTACVNPGHLDPVPNGLNVKRGDSPSSVNREKTHCLNGHEFDPENTYITTRGERSCRTCHREYQREWQRLRRLKVG
jgi:hypothetical protein